MEASLTKRKAAPKPALKNRPSGMSQSEFGKHTDLSQQRVAQLVASGTISTMANGRIDPEIARIEYIRAIRRSPASEEVRRVAAARAIAIEIQNAKQLRELIPFEDVAEFVSWSLNVLSSELTGVASAATRDRELRTVIDRLISEAVGRCKGRFAAGMSAAQSGKPLQLDGGEDGDESDD